MNKLINKYDWNCCNYEILLPLERPAGRKHPDTIENISGTDETV